MALYLKTSNHDHKMLIHEVFKREPGINDWTDMQFQRKYFMQNTRLGFDLQERVISSREWSWQRAISSRELSQSEHRAVSLHPSLTLSNSFTGPRHPFLRTLSQAKARPQHGTIFPVPPSAFLWDRVLLFLTLLALNSLCSPGWSQVHNCPVSASQIPDA